MQTITKNRTQTKSMPQTKSSAITEITYFTRKHLILASKLGIKWDYNRQVSERVAEIPDLKYPITVAMPHYHRHGVRCEMHIRCMILLEPLTQRVVFCDVPVKFFKKLPRMTVPEGVLSDA